MQTIDELKAKLAHFTGTEEYHREGMCLPFTDGIQALIDEAKCFWFISDLSIVSRMKFRNVPFQVWTLTSKDGKAVMTMKEDSGCKPRYTQRYSITDFPEGSIDVWVENGVLILPSEH